MLAKFAVSVPTLRTPGQAQRVTPGATRALPALPSLFLSILLLREALSFLLFPSKEINLERNGCGGRGGARGCGFETVLTGEALGPIPCTTQTIFKIDGLARWFNK